jgi:hypothetical protein
MHRSSTSFKFRFSNLESVFICGFNISPVHTPFQSHPRHQAKTPIRAAARKERAYRARSHAGLAGEEPLAGKPARDKAALADKGSLAGKPAHDKAALADKGSLAGKPLLRIGAFCRVGFPAKDIAKMFGDA